MNQHAVADAARRVGTTIASLGDDQARGASRLPGWTRGHVVTHLARNADAMRNIVEGAIAGEERAAYPDGAAGREAAIEAGAGRGAPALIADFETSQQALDDAWRAMPDDAWSRTGIWLVHGRQAVLESLHTRRRELLVHWIDLDLDASPSDLPDDFVRVDLEWLRGQRTTPTWPDAPW